MLENPRFAETHAFREAFLADRAAGFIVRMQPPAGLPSAVIHSVAPFGDVLLIFERVEQADAVAASYEEPHTFSAVVTVVSQIAAVTKLAGGSTPVYPILVDHLGVIAPLSADWKPRTVGERPVAPRPKKPRRRR